MAIKFEKCILCIIVVILFIFTCIAAESLHYNNGQCYRCGEKYEIIERSQAGTYYKCPECGFGTYYWRDK